MAKTKSYGLFGNEETKKILVGSSSSWDYQQAQCLARIIQAKYPSRVFNLQRDAEYLKHWREGYRYTTQEIEGVLVWIKDHWEEVVPKLLSMKSFCARYTHLRQMVITISPLAQKVIDRFGRVYHWDTQLERAQFPTLVEVSVRTLTAVQKELYRRQEAGCNHCRWLWHVMTNPFDYAVGWWEEVYDISQRWSRWKRSLLGWEIHLNSRRFTRQMVELIQERLILEDAAKMLWQDICKGLRNAHG